MKLIDSLKPESREALELVKEKYPTMYESIVNDLTESESIYELKLMALSNLSQFVMDDHPLTLDIVKIRALFYE